VLRCIERAFTNPQLTITNTMMNRLASSLSLLLVALPLTACGGGGDDDSSKPAPPPSPFAGKTYYLSIAKNDWSYPRGIQKDLFPVAPAFFLKVGQGATPTVTIASAAGTRPSAADATVPESIPVTDAKQELCGPTTNVTLGGTSPKSEIAPPLLNLFVANNMSDTPVQTTGKVFDFKLEDVLPGGGAAGTLEATMDFNDLYVLFTALGNSRTADSVCAELKKQYTPDSCMDDTCTVQCLPCPSGGSATCLTVKADGLTAVEAPGVDIVDVPVEGRPASCASSPPPSGG
jgi:hypothetical protein